MKNGNEKEKCRIVSIVSLILQSRYRASLRLDGTRCLYEFYVATGRKKSE